MCWRAAASGRLSTRSLWLTPRPFASIGIQLTSSLDTLIQSGHINPLLAIRVLNQFDRSFADTLNNKVRAKATVKGHLRDYNSCDEVWTFNVKGGTMKLDNGENLDVDRIRIVSEPASTMRCVLSPARPPRALSEDYFFLFTLSDVGGY